ncbi:hypothetical protein [Erythrobacter sp. Dej080120_24]|uniref:hypothetical protein n=1 Tax=Erythrobacter sp. Dej080120_24 TaxID=3024837 RepID=UPI0030C77A3C
MGEAAFHPEDRIGLAGAVVLHALVVAALALQFAFATPRILTPERMTVSLATEVSLESTAPDPVPESRAAIAPTLAEEPAPPVEEAPPVRQPEARTPPPPPLRARSPAHSNAPPRRRLIRAPAAARRKRARPRRRAIPHRQAAAGSATTSSKGRAHRPTPTKPAFPPARSEPVRALRCSRRSTGNCSRIGPRRSAWMRNSWFPWYHGR